MTLGQEAEQRALATSKGDFSGIWLHPGERRASPTSSLPLLYLPGGPRGSSYPSAFWVLLTGSSDEVPTLPRGLQATESEFNS